jgi:hypothetical protein
MPGIRIAPVAGWCVLKKFIACRRVSLAGRSNLPTRLVEYPCSSNVWRVAVDARDKDVSRTS